MSKLGLSRNLGGLLGHFAAAALPLVSVITACSAPQERGSERELDSVSSELRTLVGDRELIRMREWLKRNYDFADVVDTVDFNGDLFDCIPREKQRTVRELIAAGEKVDFDPPSLLAAELDEQLTAEQLELPERLSCPQGTVPQRRVTLTEIARAGTLQRYLAKDEFDTPQGPAPAEQGNHRDYATVHEIVANYGAESFINLWKPEVLDEHDHSISQIWVSGGSPNTTEHQTVEVGWRTYGWLDDTRLFVYSSGGTRSGYGRDGGFVQTDNSIALDTKFAAVSESGGAQHERRFKIVKNGDSDNWNFVYQGRRIGYWPRSQFRETGLANRAQEYKFGGEVYDQPSALHTSTDMGGDGSYARSGFRHAAYQRNLKSFKKVNGVITSSDANVSVHLVSSPLCYDLKLTKDTTNAWRHWIYFGGPGYDEVEGCINP